MSGTNGTNGVLAHRLSAAPKWPAAVSAEREVLSSLLLHADAMKDVGDLSATDFWLAKHGTIFQAIAFAYRHTGASDVTTIENILAKGGDLEEVGGRSYLLDLSEVRVTHVGVTHFASLVRDAAKQRKVLEVADRLRLRIVEGEFDTAALAAEMAEQLRALSQTGEAAKEKFFASPFELNATKRVPWIVRRLFGAGDMGVLFGPWSSFKSFVAINMAIAIADGTPFLGRQTEAGPCALLTGEGFGHLPFRLRAGLGVARMNDPDDPIHKRLLIRKDLPRLVDERAYEATVAAIEALPEKPRVLVLDTWSRYASACGLDADKNGDVSLLLGPLARLRSRFDGMSILVVAHPGHTNPDRPRGGYDLVAQAELSMRVERARGAMQTKLIFEKTRDGALPPPVTVDLAEAVVGEDEDGPVRSLYVSGFRDEPAESADAGATKGPTAKQAIRARLEEDGDLTFTAAKTAASKQDATVSQALSELVRDGFAVPYEDDRGRKHWRRP